ncbi:MAG: cytochrome c oxidase accessory protein CcoG [Chitinophagaceae bacterium]|nr:cytochrome c oxidase accessory protein CcoG [Chitinophagaceae bacterium]
MSTEKSTVEQLEESFRDRMPSVTKDGKRNWIYAWQPKGKWYTRRSVLSVLYVVLFFALPFIKINGNPALQINVVEGKFSIFGMIFWPQDFFIFGVGMVTMVIFIYLFTMIYGRVFCGWACPQTIFMEMIFRRMEWMVEGNPNEQRKLNNGPWNGNKIVRKTLKHLLFLVFSFLIANTFLAYIIGVEDLFKIIQEPVTQHVGGFVALIIFTLAFYGVYAFAREIICTVICPYGRLQSVLLDRNSMIVAYDYNRGEPRGKGRRTEENKLGDCIDCKQCVVVCPTGIDIRNGTQLECINCTACIDACDHVMDKVGSPRGLIRYASEAQLADNQPFRFTGRMKFYSVVLVLLLVGLTTLLLTRNDVDVTLLRARGQLFQEVGKDSLSNLYHLNMVNKTVKDIDVQLKVEELPGVIKLVGGHQLHTPAEGQAESTFFLVLPKSAIKRRDTDVKIGVYKDGKRIRTVKTSFLGYTE